METLSPKVQTSSAPGPVPNAVGPIMKKFSFKNKHNLYLAGAALGVVVLGVLTGWLLSGGLKSGSSSTGATVPGAVESKTEAGLADESTFKDTATGTLEKGGISGEGTHHLVRDGGASQYVYLTSTVIDLGSFEGKRIQVWGETISAKKAGWLMDVGKVKVVN
jgi:hypothetical protein